MKFVMLGSGAVGSYFGAQLQKSGREVVFVARGKQLSALREHGLTVRTPEGNTHLPTVSATDDLTSIGQADYVLISVKTWQIDSLLPQLPSLQGSDTRFLTLQNGVEIPNRVASVVGVEQTLGGLVRGFFEMEAPGIVRHVGITPTINFGQIDGQRSPQAEQLLQAFADAGIQSELAADIQVALWEKFMIVTSTGGVSTVARSTIGEVRDYEPTRRMLHAVMSEIAAVGKARGINLSEDVVERVMKFVDNIPHAATTSMYRDIVSGLPSELDAQTGAVVRLGREVSVTAPINQFIYDSLILQEMRVRQALTTS